MKCPLGYKKKLTRDQDCKGRVDAAMGRCATQGKSCWMTCVAGCEHGLRWVYDHHNDRD